MPTLTNGSHTVTTSIPAEAVAYRARGYRDVAEPARRRRRERPAPEPLAVEAAETPAETPADA